MSSYPDAKRQQQRRVMPISRDLFAEIQTCDSVKIKFETLHTMDSSDTIDIDSHMSDRASVSSKNAGDSDNMMMITPELLGLMPSGSSGQSDSGENNSRGHSGQSSSHHHGSKSWTQEDMDAALEALRNHNMSLTKASGKKRHSNRYSCRTSATNHCPKSKKLSRFIWSINFFLYILYKIIISSE